MGVVYRAVHEPDGSEVALKVLKKALSSDDVYRQRFLREARVAREVEHRHLVPIIDAGEAGGRYYLVVGYVRGRSLQDRIDAEGTLPLDDILRLTAEVGAGLDALHGRRLVHRDVKPSNIMLDERGTAALTDFGLAKGPAYTVLTRPGTVLGTLDYLAPELIQGEPAGPASDIYSLGCVVFACVAGAPPFATESILEISVAHLGKEPPDPGAGRDDLPPGFSSALLKALAKDPATRPPTARAYALALWRAAEPGPASSA